jgi:tellurite methyltransferase
MGRGRHALALARMGWRVFGVDRRLDAVRTARDRAAAEGLVVRAWCGDLVAASLPSAAFELIVVTRYLQRDLFGALRDAVAPGGVVVYETFTTHQRALGFGPTSPDHLLEPGELRERFQEFEILSYQEVRRTEAVARLVARRRV